MLIVHATVSIVADFTAKHKAPTFVCLVLVIELLAVRFMGASAKLTRLASVPTYGTACRYC